MIQRPCTNQAEPNGSPPYTSHIPIALILIIFHAFGDLFDNVNKGLNILNVLENTNARFDNVLSPTQYPTRTAPEFSRYNIVRKNEIIYFIYVME